MLVGDLLPKELNKCIFLDVDICVCKDLSEIFNIDIKDNYIAGVLDPDFYLSEEQNCKRLNISSMKQYVNIGILIMNLKEIRINNMTQKFIELSKKNYESHGQDVINVACYGKIMTLSLKYNSIVKVLKGYNNILRVYIKKKKLLKRKIILILFIIQIQINHGITYRYIWKNTGGI